MKAALAGLFASALAVAPAAASEITYALRGVGKPVPTQPETRTDDAALHPEAAPTKVVRVVLASPYGN